MSHGSGSHIAQLYLPQFEQFGLTLEPDEGILHAEASNEIGAGSAWVLPVSSTCLIMEHSVTPAHDMRLLEQTFEPYACVSQMNAQTLSCMPENGIVPGCLAQSGHAPRQSGTVCTFVQSNLHDQYSPLKAGTTYRSRSILFLSGFFDELEREWPGEFTGLFNAFDGVWSEEGLAAMTCALRQLSYRRTLRTGAQLHARSVVQTMVAELADTHMAGKRAEESRGDHDAKRLAARAASLMEHALDRGECLGIDEAAAHLYVSRSKLCAVFKAEMGEGLAAYARRRRIERACELLASPELSVAQVASQLGYRQQSTFSQAFKKACGISPTAWRTAHM